MKERVIFHCDANSFYASVEVANNPQYAGKPVAVSGNPKTRTGIILTKNHIAKKYGVLTGEAIWQAKQKCPNLICLPPNHKLYSLYSIKLRKLYEKYTDKVESFGIDECWLDVTETIKFFGSAQDLAYKIKEEVKSTLGITISVGISFCKIFAKLGSDLKKPDAITTINKEDYEKIVYPLPITHIIGIGKRLELRFNKLGINTLGDITRLPDFILKKKFGIIGLNLKQKLLGNDFEIVKNCEEHEPPKSIGNGTTTILDVYSKNEILCVVTALCDEISSRLRLGNFVAGGISVTLKTADFQHFHKSNKMAYRTNSLSDLSKNVMQLIDSFWQYNEPIRAIRICSFYLSNAKELQLDMFSNTNKNNNLNSCLDTIRSKYGYYSIAPASTIKNSHLDLSRLENVSL
ncbi:MAG: DNA polymerase IV [Clostridiales bacterium]|nr:DNA polymerase IV [Clostridiales bacterium]